MASTLQSGTSATTRSSFRATTATTAAASATGGTGMNRVWSEHHCNSFDTYMNTVVCSGSTMPSNTYANSETFG